MLNGHWNVTAIQQHSFELNVHWKVTEQCLKSGFQWTFREYSVDIQKCFSWLKRNFSSCVINMTIDLIINQLSIWTAKLRGTHSYHIFNKLVIRRSMKNIVFLVFSYLFRYQNLYYEYIELRIVLLNIYWFKHLYGCLHILSHLKNVHFYGYLTITFEMLHNLTIEQWEFFGVPHLLWQATSAYNGHLRETVTLKPVEERLAVELSLSVFTT